jgi:hypothetical protein
MIPSPDGHSGPSRQKLRLLAITVAVAAPMFWLGFVERHMVWLVPGVAVVVLARLLLPRRPAESPGEDDAPPETWRRARQRVFGRRAG